MDVLLIHPPQLAAATLITIFLLLTFQEAVNGFHDVANAVAAVIYSNSLEPRPAVLLSALFNFLGVLIGGTTVAFSLIYLLPKEMVAGISTMHELSLFLAMIVTATVWNLATWWLGIPNSTTHTYIGSIIGTGMAHAFLAGQGVAERLIWHEGEKILITLLISPVIGFVLGGMLFMLVRLFLKDSNMYKPAEGETRPPAHLRGALIASTAGVSLMHGTNDGQKTVGLLMLVLFGLAPLAYGIDPGRLNQAEFTRGLEVIAEVEEVAQAFVDHPALSKGAQLAIERAQTVKEHMVAQASGRELTEQEAIAMRKAILELHEQIGRVLKNGEVLKIFSPLQRVKLKDAYRAMDQFIQYVPMWVILLSSLALGGGTLIGYKKIVTTLGEKMGSSKMTPAQGTAAQLTTVAGIALADFGGVPVSTTHVLSSAVAGTVTAAPGQSLNQRTLFAILITWVTTLPGTVIASFVMGIIFHTALV